ncbi:hypothetical protein ABLT40_09835 [Acinetobacter schindleri]|uniref:hypothetical protein n=1 Tax=Acinetobacter schindleri TaxID=108981 RepID=UPI0032B3B3BF
MKYFKKDDKVFAFEADGSQDDYITSDMVEMTATEVKKHESNPYTDYHVWDDELLKWKDGRTPEQIAEYERSLMPTLSPIEFDIKLNRNGLYDAVQELIKDDFELRIAYTRAIFFSRTDPFIDQARQLLNLTDEQVDEMWMN